jgi:hypothetical protein
MEKAHRSEVEQVEGSGRNLEKPAILRADERRRSVLCARERRQVVGPATYNGSSWSAWANLGTPIVGQPVCLKGNASVIECLASTAAGTLVRKRFNGITWDAPEDLGGSITWQPTCIAPTVNRIDCFARGKDTQLKHIAYY